MNNIEAPSERLPQDMPLSKKEKATLVIVGVTTAVIWGAALGTVIVYFNR